MRSPGLPGFDDLFDQMSRMRRVRRTGRFDYRLTLPGEVNSESCTADLEHGVLRLRLPKASSGVRQRIPVQTRRTPEPDASKSPDTASKKWHVRPPFGTI